MQKAIFTIGHSIHSQEHFTALLRRHEITAICDVRSTPFSRVNPQFNRQELSRLLNASGFVYVFLGNELGARSNNPDCYVDGKVHYERLALTKLFRHGLERLQEGMRKYRIALMCAEGEPLECHRTILVARHLVELAVDVWHIRTNGDLESHMDAMCRLVRLLKLPEGDLFHTRQDLLADAYRLQGERIAYESKTIIHSDRTMESGRIE
jgi:uncharacterized protein (DUF488 family)